MTEQEAKEKWCPMARVYYYSNQTAASYNINFNNSIPNGALCKGSKCMMWSKTHDNEGYCGLSK